MKTSRKPEPQPLLPFALKYWELGMSLIPTKKMTKKGGVKWKPHQKRRADDVQLRIWFADTDNHLLGIAAVLGQVSGGLLCRDFDEPGSYEAWKRAEPRLAKTLPTVMAFRGQHVYFRSQNYPLSTRGTFVRKMGDGELRGDGHITVLPPSLHAKSGEPYSWQIPLTEAIPFVELGVFGIEAAEGNVTQGGLCVTSGLLASEVLRDCWTTCPPRAKEAVLEAIRLTLPEGPGKRHRQIFEFARHLRSIECVAGLSPDELITCLKVWHQLALPFISTKDFAATEKDFRDAWLLVRIPAGGEGSITRALERSLTIPPPPVAAQFRLAGLKRLVSICRELQRERGTRPFYLACRDAAEALALTGKYPHVTAWRWLEALCHSEPVRILRKVRSGNQKDHLANEYLYLPPID